MLQPAEQVVAGLLQEHVVVPLVRAVGVVVVADVSEAIHCSGEWCNIVREIQKT